MSPHVEPNEGSPGQRNAAPDGRRIGLSAFLIWGLKLGCVTAALAALFVGAAFTLLNLRDTYWAFRIVDSLSPWPIIPVLRDWGWTGHEPLSLLLSGVLNAGVFLVAMTVAAAGAFLGGRARGRHGEFSPFGRLCVELSRGAVTAAVVLVVAGVVILSVSTWYLHAAFAGRLGAFYPLACGIALAFSATGAATLLRLPMVFERPRVQPERVEITAGATREARIPGDELVRRIQRSPIYRGQFAFQKALPRIARDREGGDSGRRALFGRWPLLSGVCDEHSIGSLTTDQWLALKKLREFESRKASGESEGDLVLFGWSGSGRTTVMNIVALGTALHREGSTCWIVPERRDRSVASAVGASSGTRHPLNQLDHWLRDSNYDTLVQRAECYGDTPPAARPALSSPSDIWVCDVQALHGYVLDRASGDGRRWIERLRYVVVDHPHRMGREDLVRLRVSLARLRLTAHLCGVDPTFIVLSSRLDNAVSFAKELLNNENVYRIDFKGTYPACQIAGWQAAPELVEFEADRPRFARGPFAGSVLDLLGEIGVEAHRFAAEIAQAENRDSPRAAAPPGLRVAVVDSVPLLGPEFREHVRTAVRDRIVGEFEASGSPDDSVGRVDEQWSYFLTPDLAIDERQLFDVIICLGIGSHPEMLLAGLRPALAAQGAVVLVGDCSQADVESLRRLRRPDWDPSGPIATGTDYPELPVPEASEPVTAYELARLFEDFRDRPVSRERLESMFRWQHATAWIDRWVTEGLIESHDVFVWKGHGARPARESCLVHVQGTLAGSQFEVPWGCCTRSVYRILDTDAGRRDERFGRFHDAYMDLDRLFVDFYPGAVLRFPPSTVVVESRVDRNLDQHERERLARRYVHLGDVNVQTMLLGQALNIDRRALRVVAQLTAEYPLHPASASPAPSDTALALHPVLSTLQGESSAASRASRLDIIKHLRSPWLKGRPGALAVSGTWRCAVRERLRDVVATDARLVEDPDFVSVTPPSADQAQQMIRDFETVASSLYLRRVDASDAVPPDAECYFAGSGLQSYAAHHGLGRAIRECLRRTVLGFDGEYRLALFDNGADAGNLSGWRIMFYGLRQSEIGKDPHVGERLADRARLESLLAWTHQRLERCDCADGCSMCCGGLGVLSLAEWEASEGQYGAKFTTADVVTRRGAYWLTCLLLGVDPDWQAFVEGSRRGPDSNDGVVDEDDLQTLVAEVIGTKAGQYRDGLWTQLFGDRMVLPPARVAPAEWLADDQAPGAAGLYVTGSNQVKIRRGLDRLFLREVIVHEFAHNWQYQEPAGFDLQEHRFSDEVGQFYDGKLVIEGHATWADTQFRFSRGLSPSYSPQGLQGWHEYKSGYFLIEGIVRAVGEYGMYVWLAEGQDSKNSLVQSRKRTLPWPLSLTEAMRAIRPAGERGPSLAELSRGKKFTHWDVEDSAADTSGEA